MSHVDINIVNGTLADGRMLLDEPTDNLGSVSADALQQDFDTFEGTILVVTHDR